MGAAACWHAAFIVAGILYACQSVVWLDKGTAHNIHAMVPFFWCPYPAGICCRGTNLWIWYQHHRLPHDGHRLLPLPGQASQVTHR